MGQQRRYVSTDPNFGGGESAEKKYVSTDPNFGDPLRVATKGENIPAEAPPAPSWADQLGLNQPTDSMLGGFLRGSGAAALDMVQGASAAVQNRVARGGDPELRAAFGAPPVEQQQDVAHAPDTFAAKVGGMLPTAAEIALPGAGAVKGGKAAINALPSAARAGEKFQDVMGAARSIPIDNAEVGNVALRIAQLAEHGGSMPMSVRKLINYSTDPNKPQMTYEVARDFASNISRLSVDEYKRMTPVVAREVAKLSAALNQANARAAQLAGKGAEYKSAMREYARAMRIQDAIDTTVRGAKKALPIVGGAGLGAWLTGKVVNAIRGIE